MTLTTQESTTPETDRMNAFLTAAQGIITFAEWAADQGYVLVRAQESSDAAFGGRTVWIQEILGPKLDALLARYYGIDLDKVAAERHA